MGASVQGHNYLCIAWQGGEVNISRLIETERAWLVGREEKPEWAHVWQKLMELQPGDAELNASGRAWLVGREERPEWVYVASALIRASGDGALWRSLHEGLDRHPARNSLGWLKRQLELAAAHRWLHLPGRAKESLWHEWTGLWVFHSNAIEGSKVSQAGTARLIANPDLKLAEYSEKDQRETRNHAVVLREIVWPAVINKKYEWTVQDVHALHARLLQGHHFDIDAPLGAWRNTSIHVNNVDGTVSEDFPFPIFVPALMDIWLRWFNRAVAEGCASRERGAETFAKLHVAFTRIHPYFDGNGRMVRILCNLPLLRSGLPPIILPTGDLERKVYWGFLAKYEARTGVPRDEASLASEGVEVEEFGRYCDDKWDLTWRQASDAVLREWNRR